MRTLVMLTIAACLAFSSGPLLGAEPTREPTQVSTVLRQLDDAIEWATRMRKALPDPTDADRLLDALATLSRQGEDISPEVLALLKRDYLAKCTASTIDPTLLRLMTHRPELRDVVWELATKAPVRDVGPRLKFLAEELGAGATRVLAAITRQMPEYEWQLLMRALNRNTLSSEQIGALVEAIARLDIAPTQMGELYEVVARQLLTSGQLRVKAGLKPGSKVVAGKHNAIHGIDGIGAAPDGVPAIFEFSMYPGKKLASDSEGLVQLSHPWIASRWNELIDSASPERLEELAQIGIDRKWLRTVSEQDVKTWLRRFVAAHESALSDANKMAAGLGPDDLILLGAR